MGNFAVFKMIGWIKVFFLPRFTRWCRKTWHFCLRKLFWKCIDVNLKLPFTQNFNFKQQKFWFWQQCIQWKTNASMRPRRWNVQRRLRPSIRTKNHKFTILLHSRSKLPYRQSCQRNPLARSGRSVYEQPIRSVQNWKSTLQSGCFSWCRKRTRDNFIGYDW